MNVKETIELISYLKDRREQAANERDYYQECYQKLVDKEEDQNQKFYKDQASKSGMEVSQLDYFIRILEQIEVTK